MGQDYSYSQPSSSSEFDTTSLLLAEAEAYADEAESTYTIEEPVQYPLQPEADEGIPTTCYCGAEPVVETSYTPRDPGRRYFSCVNVDDGDCHIWKWWDVAIMEEMRDAQRKIRLLKDQFFETDQKVAKLEKTVGLLRKKNSRVAKGVCLLVMVITVLILCWKSFRGFKPQRLNSRLSCQVRSCCCLIKTSSWSGALTVCIGSGKIAQPLGKDSMHVDIKTDNCPRGCSFTRSLDLARLFWSSRYIK
ncbi:PREDICTED: uncharacterized protein LOC106321078 [Brassica oleracea var. oleracea]|uniref:uncharacterized protein LOC106321078 n=1 Tax=Brassica oleracea var. oleracea TaxID=109376 RepID=UPI0006A72BBB|nr:PREDICTED: uncharacterized protein LOC106321078 [Brassica oleracea var. oleracea]